MPGPRNLSGGYTERYTRLEVHPIGRYTPSFWKVPPPPLLGRYTNLVLTSNGGHRRRGTYPIGMLSSLCSSRHRTKEVLIGASCTVTLVPAFGFFRRNLGRWRVPMNGVYHCMNTG